MVATPGKKTIAEVSEFLSVTADKVLKSLIVVSRFIDAESGESRNSFCMLLLRGDHELNEIKLQKIIGDFDFAKEEEIEALMHCRPGYIGPITAEAFPGRIIADYAVENISDFVCGANEAGFHYTGVNWERDWKLMDEWLHDIRQIVDGDPSPDGQGNITIARGIEVGHIFQLGNKYSESMNAAVVNEAGKNQIMIMGCYGIGISRVVAAAIEQGHDERGIIWPNELAPFQVAICPMNMHKSDRLVETVETVYQDLQAAGIEVLLDDRKVRAGFMFSDMELIGIPHRIVIGDRGLDSGTVEYQGRTDSESQEVPFTGLVDFIKSKLA
jgi:prolyl-tRNA synthetase